MLKNKVEAPQQALASLEIEASKSLISYEYDILKHSKILKTINDMNSLQENLIHDLQDIERHKLDCFRKLNLEEKIHHQTFEHRLMEELLSFQKNKIDTCRKLLIEHDYRDDGSQVTYPQTLATHITAPNSLTISKPTFGATQRLNSSSSSNEKDSSDFGELMDLNLRFEALKSALDSGPLHKPQRSPASISSRTQHTPSLHQRTYCHDSTYVPISPSDLVVTTGGVDSKLHYHDPSQSLHPQLPNGADSATSASRRRHRQPERPSNAQLGPRLQVPFWMRHHSTAIPSPPEPPAPRPRQERDRPRSNHGSGTRQETGRGRDALTDGAAHGPIGQSSACVQASRAGSRPRGDDPSWASAESDPEEAEHRAIMRRLDDSGDWAPDPTELLVV